MTDNVSHTVDCPICGASAFAWAEKSGYPLARCRRCAHLFSLRRPDPEQLAEYYRRYAYERYDLAHVPAFVRLRLSEQLRPFLRPGGPNRLLDVGFGAGALLVAAAEIGFDAAGIETSELAVEQGLRNGLKVAHGDFLRASYEPASFDVVCMVELVEHLLDPLPFLAQARRLLAPAAGRLFLTTPNGAGLSARLLGDRWSVVSPPEHLQLFSPQSIRHALQHGGFTEPAVACEGLNPHELWHAFRPHHSSTQPVFDRVKTSCALNERLSTSAIGSVLKTVANAALNVTRLGDTLKVSARAG